MKKKIRGSFERSWYFGKEEAEKFGDIVEENLTGKTVSKRRDLANEPGGLIYEADQLGMDMWDLLNTLEGLCYQGRCREIDDSTYLVGKVGRGMPGARDVESSKKVESSTYDSNYTAIFNDVVDFVYDKYQEAFDGYDVMSAISDYDLDWCESDGMAQEVMDLNNSLVEAAKCAAAVLMKYYESTGNEHKKEYQRIWK